MTLEAGTGVYEAVGLLISPYGGRICHFKAELTKVRIHCSLHVVVNISGCQKRLYPLCWIMLKMKNYVAKQYAIVFLKDISLTPAVHTLLIKFSILFIDLIILTSQIPFLGKV